MIEINNLHVSIKGKEILQGINMTIPDGQVHALFGPNGSGKTTLMMAIIGYPEYEVTKGEVLFNGKSILELEIDERARLGIGVAQQRPPTIKGVTLSKILDFYGQKDPKKVAYIDKMVEKFNMLDFIDREINKGLSGGEIKRSEIFQLLVSCPSFLMLDEPDSGIDPEYLSRIGGMLRETMKAKNIEEKLNSGLIITHTGHILNYFHADVSYLLIDGILKCKGSPRIMLEQIGKHGYSYCIQESCKRAPLSINKEEEK